MERPRAGLLRASGPVGRRALRDQHTGQGSCRRTAHLSRDPTRRVLAGDHRSVSWASSCRRLRLTTRRFHWAGRRGRADSTAAFVDDRGQPRPPLGRAVAYDEIAEISDQGIRLAGLDPKSAERVAFGPHGLNVPGELAVVLKNLRQAARGDSVSLSSRAEELARAELPKVRHLTADARAVQGRMRSFPDLLKASTPRVVATPAIAALCVLCFAMVQAHGVPSTPRRSGDVGLGRELRPVSAHRR